MFFTNSAYGQSMNGLLEMMTDKHTPHKHNTAYPAPESHPPMNCKYESIIISFSYLSGFETLRKRRPSRSQQLHAQWWKEDYDQPRSSKRYLN